MFTRRFSAPLLTAIAALFILKPGVIAAQQPGAESPFDKIEWARGPLTGMLGKVAELAVPATCSFTDAAGTKQFLKATENPVDGSELGILLCDGATEESNWFVVFSFRETGFVKDDEKASLDSNVILKSLRRGNEAGNRERRSQGWEELDILGWERAPHYDAATNNLTWSVLVKSRNESGVTVNHSVRLLGRGGVMHADLVVSMDEMAATVPVFDSVLTEYSFASGHRYAEWRAGDKVAKYGLTALIAGGAGVTAAKLGFFPKIWKLFVGILIAGKKLIIVAVLAIGAALKKIFGAKSDAPTTA